MPIWKGGLVVEDRELVVEEERSQHAVRLLGALPPVTVEYESKSGYRQAALARINTQAVHAEGIGLAAC